MLDTFITRALENGATLDDVQRAAQVYTQLRFWCP
jgi:hypothetical protein